MKKPRKYDKEFKLNAVNLYKESGKPCDEIAKNLGIPKSTLYTWAIDHATSGVEGFKGSGTPKPHNEELYSLRKELAEEHVDPLNVEVIRREYKLKGVITRKEFWRRVA